ncbi:uncharacterized protein TNCV_1543291 [Trichonephila clavipes]|nr:uncharacterized protein TNCV_1543291 [Trichonephila clavipes]
MEAAVAEWYRHRIVAGFVKSSSPVPLKTRRVGQRCTLNLSRAEMSSRWCGVVVRRNKLLDYLPLRRRYSNSGAKRKPSNTHTPATKTPGETGTLALHLENCT